MTTLKLRFLVGCVICAGTLLISGLVTSQTSNGDPPDNDMGGNDSPDGVSSGFNGMVNTACAYDPYTGNARREIDDIVVPGAVGAYPLKWTRFYNSRDPDTTTGTGVGWRHSYLWGEDYLGGDIIHFPDGRVVDFNEATGISERLPAVGQLLLGDGGQVIFEAVPYTVDGHQYAKYRVKRIIDPYGLATVMDYETIGVDDNGNDVYRLYKITEPAGRYLKLTNFNGDLIGRVEAYDAQDNLTQSVDYTYTISNLQPGGPYWILTSATYADGTSAQYTYQTDNSSKRGAPGIPLLQSCDDVRYAGPMHQIDYLFVQGDRIRGKIKSERKPGSNQAVSTLTFPANRTQNRTETRGDGYKRTFTYSGGGRLLSNTDFNNTYQASRLTYDGNNFLLSTKDALNHEIIYTREPNIGQTTQVLRADGVSHVDFEYTDSNNPYYLWRRSDERAAYVGDPQHSIRYDRDPTTHRVNQINYPDGATEGFGYNNFGQLLTHRRRNGAYEHFVYDSQGRLRKAWNPTATASWPPSDAEAHVTVDYYPTGHPWADRVSTVYDQRQNPSTTTYEYDRDGASQPCAGRGLVTRVTHVDGTYISFAYDSLGNVIAAENELRQRTWFSYDDYNRIQTITPPAPAGPITFTYERAGAGDPYLHTARAVHIATDGAGVTVERVYDPNFRVKSVAQIDGTTTPPTTRLDYWDNGLVKLVHDPRNYNWTTSYTYTARNQVETVLDALQHQTLFHYDPAGNVDYIDRPDSKRITRSYDQMGRVLTLTEPLNASANKTTTFTYWPSGRVNTVKDNNNQTTTFTYDNFDRQQYMFYPDGSFQQWDYDAAGVLRGYRNAGGKIQRFDPDNRNRITDMWWDPGNPSDESAHFEYDAASQLIGASNQNGTITRTYDDAGRLISEKQDLKELRLPSQQQNVDVGAKTVSYGYDGAGKRNAMGIAGTDYQFGYQYDALGRLEQILNVQNTPNGPTASLWFQYSYDAASNQTQRYCPMNGVAQIYDRDELGRIGGVRIQKATEPRYGTPPNSPIGVPNLPQPGVPLVQPFSLLAGLTNLTGNAGAPVPSVGTVIGRESYSYNPMSQVTQIFRQGQDEVGNDNYSQDTYSYDYSGQLSSATYTAWGWNPNNTRNVSYTQDALGNRSQVNDNGTAQGYSQVSNYRNQYASGPAGGINNGSDHEIATYAGLSYAYRNDGKLASASGNGNSYGAAYDALGRCVKRTLNGNPIYYTYDGPHPIYEWKADGTRAGMNLYGQGIDEILLRGDYVIVPNGQGYFFQQNRLGSVMLLTGFAGESIEAYRYDAFGEFVSWTAGSFNNRFKFTGREYLAPFGIYEYRNRAYHPSLGRFLSEDPTGFAAGDTNLFRYCGGDPVNRTDPFGLEGPQVTKKKDGNDSGAGDNTLMGDGVSAGTWGTMGNGDNTPVFFGGNGDLWIGDSGVYGGGPVISNWGDRSYDGAPNAGPNDHGTSGAGPGDGGGGGNGPGGAAVNGTGSENHAPGAFNSHGSGTSGTSGDRSGRGFSGHITVPWWPEWLTLPYVGPVDPKTWEWTKSGFYPTVIYGGVVFAPVWVPVVVPAIASAGVGTWNFLTRTAPYWWALFRLRELASDPRAAEPPPPPPSIVEPAPPRVGRPPIPWPTPGPGW